MINYKKEIDKEIDSIILNCKQKPLPENLVSMEDIYKWVGEPLIKYPLDPREAKAVLEIIGIFKSYGFTFSDIIRIFLNK